MWPPPAGRKETGHVRADAPRPAVAPSPFDQGLRPAGARRDVGARHHRLAGIIAPRDLMKAFLRPDADIRREIIEQVLTNGLGVPPALIGVDVVDGVATLTGEVPATGDVPFTTPHGLRRGVSSPSTTGSPPPSTTGRPRTADLTDY